jgi:hypothetical protein
VIGLTIIRAAARTGKWRRIILLAASRKPR